MVFYQLTMKRSFPFRWMLALTFSGSWGQVAFAQNKAAAPPAFKKWNFPQDALFFKVNAKDSWETLPEEQREWLAPAGLTPDVFKALDMYNTGLDFKRGAYEPLSHSQEEKRVAGAGWATWKAGVKDEWLPPMELVVPGRMNSHRGGRPSYEIAHAAFERGAMRGLYLAQVDSVFWLYLEQPLPLGQKIKPLRVADVLQPELLAGAGKEGTASVTAREFTRFRASLPKGAYQNVQILLVRVELPQSLALETFGYRGRIKP